MRLCHERCASFLAVCHKANAVGVLMKAIKHSQIAFTGHTKSVRHALGNQALYQYMTGQAGHSNRSSNISHSDTDQNYDSAIVPPLRLCACFLGCCLQYTTTQLIALHRLKQSFEIALTKTLVTFALDEFKKHWPKQGLREDLQQQPRLLALGAAIQQNTAHLQR
jgi:hypothetical protein